MFNLMVDGSGLDNAVHLATAVTAFSLFIVSLKAYLALKRRRFLYVCLAFLLYSIKEIIVVSEVLSFRNSAFTEISHVMNLAILLLFFAGLIKK